MKASTMKVEDRGVWVAKYLGSCRYSVTSPDGTRGIYSADAHAMGHAEAAAEAVRLHCDRLYAEHQYYGLLGDHLDVVGGLLKGATYAFAVLRGDA